MATKGRKALPEEIKSLRGTTRKCRSKPHSIGFKKTISVPKVDLCLPAKKIFNDIARELISCGILENVSTPLLASYANEMYVYWFLMKDVETEGYTIQEETKTGIKVKVNPKRTMALQALQMAKSIASDFGFTPATRSRIDSLLNPNKNENNEFADFIEL